MCCSLGSQLNSYLVSSHEVPRIFMDAKHDRKPWIFCRQGSLLSSSQNAVEEHRERERPQRAQRKAATVVAVVDQNQ